MASTCTIEQSTSTYLARALLFDSRVKDGKELTADKRLAIETTEDGVCSLTISKATETDEGEYSCTATNSSGTATTSAKLTVAAGNVSPQFRNRLEAVEVTEGQTAVLACEATGVPFPEVTW